MEKRLNWLLGNIRDCLEFMTVCWTFLMLTIFPLYVPDKYRDIGAYKFSFFSGVSTLLLAPGIVLAAVYLAGRILLRYMERRRTGLSGNDGDLRQGSALRLSAAVRDFSGRRLSAAVRAFSCLDAGVCAYLLWNVVSYAMSDFKTDAWAGVGGWNMGLRTQLLMGASYVLLSRFFPWRGDGGHRMRIRMAFGDTDGQGKSVLYLSRGAYVVLAGFAAGSGLTFLLGVLHRFGIDPLGFYDGLDSVYQLQFLSTLGQATWYSSYVCTVLPIGIAFFWFCEGRRARLLWGLYCMLGFMTLVTQNSDSAFAALAVLFSGFFLAGCRGMALGRCRAMERFLETVILCGASFKAVGILQRIFPEQAVELGSLSEACSKGPAAWGLLLAGTAAYILLIRVQEKQGAGAAAKLSKPLFRGAVCLGTAGVLGSVALIAANSTGLLEKWFGVTFSNSYLLFNDKWGSDRGFTWKCAAQIFREMPFAGKLFGAGPDCFMAYSYSIPEYAGELNAYWKPNVLTNAHNEYLNLLICTGVPGLLAFLFMLGSALKRFYHMCIGKPFVLAGLLAVCSYGAHNFFCYQQVCATPFLFLILGLSERLAREGNTV